MQRFSCIMDVYFQSDKNVEMLTVLLKITESEMGFKALNFIHFTKESLLEMGKFISCVMDVYFQNEDNQKNCLVLLYVRKNEVGFKSKNFFYFTKQSVSKFILNYITQIISLLMVRRAS